MREAAFDEAHGSFEGDGLRGEEEVDVVGHDDEGVEEVVAFGAVLLKGGEEEVAVYWRNTGEAYRSAGVEEVTRLPGDK